MSDSDECKCPEGTICQCIECQCCEYDNKSCTCLKCHACTSCFGCEVCTCVDIEGETRPDCNCNSPPDCACSKCIVNKHCPNYDFCKNKLPQILLDCYRGRCMDCDVILGRNYTFVTVDSECILCYDTKHKFVKLPNCTHIVCTYCFNQFMLKSDNPNRCPYCRSGKGSAEWQKQR